MADRGINWISTDDQKKIVDQQSAQFYVSVPAYNTSRKITISEFLDLFVDSENKNVRFMNLTRQLAHIDPPVIAVIEENSPFGCSQYPNRHLVTVGNHIFITNQLLLEWAENGIDGESERLLCKLLLKADNVNGQVFH